MSYSERIDAVKNEIDALVTYANETTGESDTTIGDAVGHLVEGFGGGGEDLLTIREYTQEEDWASDTEGNLLNFVNTYVPEANDTSFSGVAFAYVKGNTYTDNFSLNEFMYSKNSDLNFCSIIAIRGNYTTSRNVISTSSSVRISKGAIIKVYVITSPHIINTASN